MTIEVERRIYPAGKINAVHVSMYNMQTAQLALYAVDLEQLAPGAFAMWESRPEVQGSLPYYLKHLNLAALRPAAQWGVALQKLYPDEWQEKPTRLPSLPEGVYVLVARGGGVEDRTWVAISSRAMVVKRSPDKILGWVVDSKTGKPIANVPVALYDAKKRVSISSTSADGLVSFPMTKWNESCYLASRQGGPAFAMAVSPGNEAPYIIYMYTDRPIYRPGHVVRFRGTVRAAARGKYALPPAGLETVKVQIRSPKGGTVYEKNLALNEWGTFTDEFALAPEPPLGNYEIVSNIDYKGTQMSGYGAFEVQAYRKPEFEVNVAIPKSHYLGGEKVPVTISAMYYFGSPVSGGKVDYQVSFNGAGNVVEPDVITAAGLGSAANVRVEPGFKGQAVLDKDGKFLLEVPTRYVPQDRSLTVQATVQELALRPQQGSASTTITAAKFRMYLWVENEPLIVGDQARVRVETDDYDGKPVSARVKLTLIETMKDREGRTYEQKTPRDVETASDGKVVVTYPLKRPGYYTVKAWGLDDAGNPTGTSVGFEVLKERPKHEWPALDLTTDKDSYKTGDTARVHVQTSLVGAWFLVTVEGQYLFDSWIVQAKAHEFDMRVPIVENYKPGVKVAMVAVREGEMTSGSGGLSVPQLDKRLDIIVTPDHETYEPAQDAKWSITTRDWRGGAASAELGVGIVDESLYAIREDSTPSPYDVFWGSGAERVTTDFSLGRLYPGGGYQAAGLGGLRRKAGEDRAAMAMPAPAMMATAAAGPAGPSGSTAPRVRTNFLDTAFWGPSVVTGPDGRAEFTFTIPDNLTTWRATARGMTRETIAGDTRHSVKVTMPLLVRLTLPRFYVEGDEGTAAAIVHNYTGQERQVKVVLTAEGAQVLGDKQQTITLANDGIQRLTWRIKAQGPDEAKFLVSADGGAGASDAMQSTLPVVPNGVENIDAWAGVADATTEAKIPLPADAVAKSGRVELAVSPSLAGPIFQALDFLTEYPYGCAEQTMDSFLPDVIVTQTLAKLKVDRPRPKMLDRYVSFGLQKLQRYQHEDGGWHWWEFDDSDPYISAYIVYGLKLADDAGCVGAHQAMVKGAVYLRGALQNEDFREAQAYLLWAMAFADVWDKDSLATASATASKLFDDRKKLNIFSQASLARAMKRLSAEPMLTQKVRDGMATAAAKMADEFEAAGLETGLGVHWSADASEEYSWMDNDVEVTSQVLAALLEVKPDSPKIVGGIRWLMASRRGNAWYSTKDTAAAVLVLAAYLEGRKEELKPDYSLRVMVNDAVAGEMKFTSADVFADPKVVTIAADKLKPGDNVVRLEKTGDGAMYWSARLYYVLPPEKAVPYAKGISVKRTYRLPSENPLEAADQVPGSLVQVEVRLTMDQNLRYAMLEEPIPAGCEIVAGDEDDPRSSPWDRREVWDNKLLFFFDYLPRGERTIEYYLRTEAPGQYNILPSAATLMYFPEFGGRGKLVRMRILDVAP